MKKLSLLFLAMLFCFACSSGKSGDEIDDSDGVNSSDADTTADSDSDPTDDSDTQKPASDDDNTADDSDSEAVSGICSPNPCDQVIAPPSQAVSLIVAKFFPSFGI